jgi:hypothetical protein
MVIKNARVPASPEDILRFETAIAAPLPEDYRSFLLQYNGGKPSQDIFRFSERGATEEDIVDWFLSLGGDPNYDIELFVELTTGRIPPDCIPFAIDPGGNFLLLSVRGARCSAVLFWDHEREAEEGQPPSEDNVYPVCTGFSTFLASLIPG